MLEDMTERRTTLEPAQTDVDGANRGMEMRASPATTTSIGRCAMEADSVSSHSGSQTALESTPSDRVVRLEVEPGSDVVMFRGAMKDTSGRATMELLRQNFPPNRRSSRSNEQNQ